MVRKKMEGDEDQRRTWAREAERVGERPSGRGTTTGASKQRTHVSHQGQAEQLRDVPKPPIQEELDRDREA
ncbi:hypothetical protein ACSNOC_13505, partial [Streptomyces sp. URMC 129]